MFDTVLYSYKDLFKRGWRKLLYLILLNVLKFPILPQVRNLENKIEVREKIWRLLKLLKKAENIL